jgi:hypothetical protein
MSEEKIRFHEAANIFPMLSGDELTAFENDVRAKGILEPVTVWYDDKGKRWLLDGRNRWTVGQKLRKEGVEINGKLLEIPEVEFKGTPLEALSFSLSKNLHGRRHMTSSQRAACACVANRFVLKHRQKETGEKPEAVKGDVAAIIAALVGTNRSYVYRCIQLLEHAPHLLAKVQTAEFSIPQALAAWAQEQAKEAAQDEVEVLDSNKDPVPAEYVETFLARNDFDEAVAKLREAKKMVRDVLKGPAGHWLDEREPVAFINNAVKMILAARPHSMCAVCMGTQKTLNEKGKKVRCDHCDGHGYVTEARSQGRPPAEVGQPDEPEVVDAAGANDAGDDGGTESYPEHEVVYDESQPVEA